MGVIISGIGGAVPANEISNEAISERVDTTPDWIFARTGIRTRYHAGSGATTSGLAAEAARNAIISSGTDRNIDLVLLATTTPDRLCPATAPKVAYQLGLGSISAVDISAVCSGFIYALQLAVGALSAGMASRVLVIGAEIFSTILDPADRTTLPIFGDGAGALIVEIGDDQHVLDVSTGSDGGFEDLITISGRGVEAHFNAAMSGHDDPFFRMEGRTVFQMAVETMARSVSAILEKNCLDIDNLDLVVGHQANARILTTLGEQLGLSAEKIVISLDKFGNTSAASIPLALADAAGIGRVKPGNRIALTAFGGGLTWGSALIIWPHLAASPSITYLM